jgi:hypothetical protein
MEEHGDEHLTWEDDSPQFERWEVEEALADERGDNQWLEDN